jgi:hypothetical protein
MDPISREGWPKGPWDDEPDEIEWTTAVGFRGLIMRSDVTGALCGYVAVPPGHPCYGKPRDELRFNVHGGVTYARRESDPFSIPRADPSADLYWIGFDCGHGMDLSPLMLSRMKDESRARLMEVTRYCDAVFVREQVEQLAAQLVYPRPIDQELERLLRQFPVGSRVRAATDIYYGTGEEVLEGTGGELLENNVRGYGPLVRVRFDSGVEKDTLVSALDLESPAPDAN